MANESIVLYMCEGKVLMDMLFYSKGKYSVGTIRSLSMMPIWLIVHCCIIVKISCKATVVAALIIMKINLNKYVNITALRSQYSMTFRN